MEPCRGDLIVGWFRGDGVRVRLDRTFCALVSLGLGTQGDARASLCRWATLVCPFGAGEFGMYSFYNANASRSEFETN